MINLNKILNESNVSSVEYSGLWSIKLSVSNTSAIYDNFPDITIEFNGGLTLIHTNEQQVQLPHNLFNLYGSCVKESSIIDEQIEIIFDNDIIVRSFCTPDELRLVDRCWGITSTTNRQYLMFSDCYELFISEEIKKLGTLVL
ncbi:MAG TPA: hypothetical protein PLW09_16295 [Candidatus Kapabacteria bacterium]|nr:hypothetical protein [Candidatus Kapabacteria bacterium]